MLNSKVLLHILHINTNIVKILLFNTKTVIIEQINTLIGNFKTLLCKMIVKKITKNKTKQN